MAGLDVGQHVVHLGGVHQGADVGGRVQRVARLPGLDGLDHHGHELVLDRALHQQARTGGADFALVEGDGAGSGFGGGLQVRGVGEDDVRALAAGFQPDALHVGFAGIDHQLLGDLGGAGEHQGIDVHVQGQGLAHGVAIAWQHVEHASRDTGFDRQLGDADGSQRRFFGRLEHDRVTGGQRRAELPAGHQQREVPRYDGTDHTYRLASNQAKLIMRGRGNFVVDLVDGFGSPVDGLGRTWDVDTGGVANRLAHVQGFQQRQLFDVLAQQVGETDQLGLALGRGQLRPHAGVEGGTGVFNSAVGIGQVAAGNLGQEASVDRAQALEGFTGCGIGVFAVDEGTAFDLQLLGTLFPVRTGQGGHTKLLLLFRCNAALRTHRRCQNSGRATSAHWQAIP
ncbi:hypothetical protein D9M71_289780 [compost metagenome]